MTPLQPTDVYVVVKTENEMPGPLWDVLDENGDTHRINKKGQWEVYNDGYWEVERFVPDHWLKPLPNSYVFSKEELEKLLGDTFDHALEWQSLEDKPTVKYGSRENYIENKEQYIQSLIK